MRTCDATQCATRPAASVCVPSVANVATAAGAAAGGNGGMA